MTFQGAGSSVAGCMIFVQAMLEKFEIRDKGEAHGVPSWKEQKGADDFWV